MDLNFIIGAAFFDFFKYLFEIKILQYALIAGIIVGVLAPLIGSVVIIRRLSFIADTLSHFSLAGVALGSFLGILTEGTWISKFVQPIWMGVLFSIIGTFVIEKLRSFYKNYKELSMPIVMSLGVALSGIFISLSDSGSKNTNSLLFGSIYAVDKQDIIYIIMITIIIFIFMIVFRNKIITLCFDETYAKLSGINVKLLQLIITIVLALFVSIFMEIIGVLLISALMILPVASSILIGDSFKNSIILAIIFSEISVVFGFLISYSLEVPTGSIIVVINVIILITIMIFRKVYKTIKKTESNKKASV
jgi:zinc transport system permease protein